MIDLAIIRDNPGRIKAEVKKRGLKIDVEKLVRLDGLRRQYQAKFDELRAKQKSIKDATQGKKLKTELKKIEVESKTVHQEFQALYLQLPNFSTDDVPVGKDEKENKPVRQVGKKPKPKGAKEHFAIPAVGSLFELERSTKVAGSRFNYLKGPLALLEFALINYALSVLTDERQLAKIAKSAKLKVPTSPFTPIIPPALVRTEIMQKMARLDPPEDKYHLLADGLTLAGSAEHSIGSMHANETFDEKTLPIRYLGFSTSFRREAGSYGKDTRGIIRRHQFDKLEMESFTVPEQSQAEQDFLVAIQEYLVSSLGLPYQVVAICTGDMGLPDARQIDIEVWMPGEGKYRETHTADFVSDYQARRLNTKVKMTDGRKVLAQMNDATAYAIGRTIIAICENYQDKDGNVDMPKVLHPYLPFKKISKGLSRVKPRG